MTDLLIEYLQESLCHMKYLNLVEEILGRLGI